VVVAIHQEDREVADAHQGEVVLEREEAHRADEPLDRVEEEGRPLLLAAAVPCKVEARQSLPGDGHKKEVVYQSEVDLSIPVADHAAVVLLLHLSQVVLLLHLSQVVE
jgi:hypothetical protein